MEVERIQTDAIEVPSRLRAVDPDKVRALADSMDAIGLRQPITVWSRAGDHLDIVAGAHRLEAAQFLGWEWIDAVFIDGDDIDRQLWEIDENLMRAELSATQMAEHLSKRKELWAVRSSGATCATGGGAAGENRQFASETAGATGVTKSTINRATSRAENITQEARDLLRGTKLDTGVFLDLLKKVPEPDQVAFVKKHMTKSPPVKVREKREVKSDAEVIADQVEDMVNRWNKMSPEARAMFLDEIDTPVMDRGAA